MRAEKTTVGSNSIKRPEIQALRAVAVVAVVGFHLWSTRLPGGYVGVDIFFGISGYLIVGHLLKEVDRTGRIGLASFWARRARRLLPASLLVLAVTGVGVLIWAPTVVWLQWFSEIAGSAAYVENWMLAASSVDYLGAANSASPTQHYWSLSVEEQFYIVWPVLIMLAILATRGLTARVTRRTIVVVLALVSAASFVYSVIDVSSSPAPAYFDTAARAWEFGLGGLLAVAGTAGAGVSPRLRAVASWLGIVVIGLTLFFYNPSTPFPGPAALVPVAATLLVIWAGVPSVPLAPSRLLSLRPVQWMGDVSYSLYLWHWPFVVLVPIALGHSLGTIDKIVILLVAIGLAWLTKRYVEDTVRTGALLSQRRPVWTFAAVVVATGVLFAGSGIVDQQVTTQNAAAAATVKREITDLNGCIGAAATEPESTCPRPYAFDVLTDPSFARTDIGKGVQVTDSCKVSIESTRVVRCDAGDTKSPRTQIALIGDSHAGQFYEALNSYGKAHGIEFVAYLKTFCAGTGVPDVGGGTPLTPVAVTSCATWGSKVLADVRADPKITGAIFANYTQRYSAPPVAGRSITSADFEKAWSGLISAGKSVIAIRDTPGTNNRLIPYCISESGNKYDPCTTPRNEALPSARDNPMIVAAAANPKVKLIDLSNVFCDATTCHSLIGGLVVYFDANHMTATFSRTLSSYLGKEIVGDIDSPN